MKNINFIYVIIAVAIIVLIYTNKEAIAAKLPKITGSNGNNNEDAPSTTGSQTEVQTGMDYDRLLTSGARGAEVLQLQKWINQAGYTPPLVADGIFGIKTNNAVKKYNNGSASITLRQAMALIMQGIKQTGLF